MRILHMFTTLIIGALMVTLILVGAAYQQSQPPAALPPIPSADWRMFHRDELHSGVITDSIGNINPQLGPTVLWQYRVTDQPGSQTDMAYYRWTSTFPLGDLDGDGTLEVVVTTPDVAAPLVARLNGEPVADRIMALKTMPGQVPAVQRLWVYTSTLPAGQSGYDTYSPALADADLDGKPDVIFTSRDGYLRALKGTTGALIWQYQMGRISEAGPMVADLDDNGNDEAIIVTDEVVVAGNCQAGALCLGTPSPARVIVVPVTSTGTITHPLWSLDYPFKMDSAEPTIADLDVNDGRRRKAIIVGTWGGELLVVWRNQNGEVVTNTLKLRELDHTIPITYTPVIRSSPLVWDWGEGPTAVFAWLPTDLNVSDSRISAIGLSADMANGTVAFTNRWTIDSPNVWKSSPTLLPQPSGSPPKIVAGYGLGVQQPGQSGSVGSCDAPYVTGGVVALTYTGQEAWRNDFSGAEGNIRASPAIADLDSDGHLDIVFPVGCFGKLYIYDGASGAEKWTLQLGPRSQGSPSLGDINGDGYLDIVLSSYDGNVWALSGGSRVYLPLVRR